MPGCFLGMFHSSGQRSPRSAGNIRQFLRHGLTQKLSRFRRAYCQNPDSSFEHHKHHSQHRNFCIHSRGNNCSNRRSVDNRTLDRKRRASRRSTDRNASNNHSTMDHCMQRQKQKRANSMPDNNMRSIPGTSNTSCTGRRNNCRYSLCLYRNSCKRSYLGFLLVSGSCSFRLLSIAAS